jgi:hypothetical protein
MDDSKSRIIAQDAIILFADLQTGIVELSQTNPLERLKRGCSDARWHSSG